MAFYSATGTKLLNLPEQVQKNIDDIAELKESITSLQNSKQDVTGAITESNLQAKIEDIASLSLKEVSVTGLTNTGNTVNNGTLDQEGKATAGGDQEVDGNLILNSADNVVDKDGNKLIQSAALDDFLKRYNAEAYQWKFASKELADYEEWTRIGGFNPSYTIPHFVEATDIRNCFANATLTASELIIPQMVASQVLISTAFENFHGDKVTFKGGNFIGTNVFFNSEVKQVLTDGDVYLTGYCANFFIFSRSLEEVGEFDMSGVTTFTGGFMQCEKLKSVHCKHWSLSFDISASTAFEESDLVEIIGNLDTVTTAQTLTMGATNLAKLTQEEILVATGKGWTLA